MREELFRKKSLEKARTPYNMSDYVKVAGPGTWLVVLAVVVILIGTVVWGCAGRIETTVDLNGTISNGVMVCEAPDRTISKIEEGMEVRVGDSEGKVTDVNIENGTVTAEIDLPNGTASAEVVTASIKPITLIFN